MRRAGLVVVALGLATALWLLGSAGAQSGGGAEAQPVLGVADQETILMGAAGRAAPGEVWAYRRLPLAVGPPVFGGSPLEYGPAPAGGGTAPGQLAFLRYTTATGWQVAETPLDRGSNPYRGPAPNRLSARVTPRGGGLLVGRDSSRASETQVVALVRRPGGRFREVPPPDFDDLRAEDQPAEGDEREVIAEDRGAGRIAVAAVEEGDEVNAFFGVLGRDAEDAVLRFDGGAASDPYTREPIELPPEMADSFKIAAIDARSEDDAWLLGQSGDGEPGLFERVVRDGAAVWVQRALDLPEGPKQRILAGSADPLTVAEDGVWIDGTLDADAPSPSDFTVLRPRGDGGATTSYCDTSCERPFGATFSRDQGYRSIALPGGARVLSNPLPAGSTDDETNRGAYLLLQDGRWDRRPGGGGNFRPSAAFSTPTEGWLEGPVHVTTEPKPDRLRTWPVALRAPLTAAVTAPGQAPASLDSRALAVGQDGGVTRYVPGEGWTREFLLTSNGSVARPLLRGVAWPELGRAHAVGDLGAMWQWRAETQLWERDPAAPIGFEGNLMGVAFEPGDPGRGYAVGKDGVLLGYDKTWTQRALPAGFEAASFTSIAFAGRQAIVAAGRDLLIDDGSGFKPDEGVRELFAGLPDAEPEFFAVAGLPDGGAVAAGRDLVIERDSAGGPWRFARQPLLGVTPVALAAFRDGESVRAVAAVQPALRYPVPDIPPTVDPDSPTPLIPPFPLPGDGYIVRETAEGWRDEQRSAYAGSGFDRPVKTDPIGAFLLDGSGQGWAIGGWSGEADSAGRGNASRSSQGKADRARVQTAGIYRYATGAQPAAPAGVSSPGLGLDSGVVRFAVGGHAQCEERCEDLRDAAIAPDRQLRSALAKVGELSSRDSGPRFMLYTGGRLGARGGTLTPREAGRYASVMSAGTPVFPALSRSEADDTGSTAFKSAFAGFAAPFGSGAAPPGVNAAAAPGAPAGPGARTHYAFDSNGAGGALRVIVIDNSAGSLAASDPHQNPPEPQAPWLAAALADARADGIPSVVMGSRDLNSRFRPRTNVASDADETARMLVDGGASAYFFDRPEENRSYAIPSGAQDTIPSFGTGTLGYKPPLANVTGDEPDAVFADVGYLLVGVDARKRDPRTNRAPVSARLIPLIDDVIVLPVDGLELRRSRPSLFQGLGRKPISGDRWGPTAGGGGDPQPPGGDPYTLFPPAPCRQAGCGTRLEPEYEFRSSDPDIGDFVAQDAASTNLRKPRLGADDKVVTDERSGLFCPFNAGTTTVTVRAGGLAYAAKIRVLAGSVQRPCGTRPLNADRLTRRTAAAVPPAPPPPAPAPAPGGSPPPPVPPPPAAPVPVAKVVPKPVKPRPVRPVVPPLDPLGVLPPLRPGGPVGLPGQPPPPAGGFARPAPPGGAVIRVFEDKREEEAAPEQQSAASAYNPDEYSSPGPYIYGFVVLAALAGASTRTRLKRRHRDLAMASLREPPHPRHRDWSRRP